ncbi:MAG: hypothetical protein EBU01_10880 [Crocinitomicaceae bacterium]|nr:hypothetical protein [Crocinitomicaceae bacterium]
MFFLVACLLVWFAQSGFILYKFFNGGGESIYEDSETESTTKAEEAEEEDQCNKTILSFEEKYISEYENEKKKKRDSCEIGIEDADAKKESLKSLKNNFVIEYTPIGNVAMYYDSERESFCYYSDNVVPYRFLETVARKYVLTFKCVEVYVDMKEELEKKKRELLEKEKEKEKEKEREKEKEEGTGGAGNGKGPKKNVFTKFKSYNTGSMGGGTDMAKMNSSVSSAIKGASAGASASGDKLLLKDNANRYTREGRFSTFFLLKKVDKTLVDKRLKVSFAEFKHRVVPLPKS